jgi:hypothetical protein
VIDDNDSNQMEAIQERVRKLLEGGRRQLDANEMPMEYAAEAPPADSAPQSIPTVVGIHVLGPPLTPTAPSPTPPPSTCL